MGFFFQTPGGTGGTGCGCCAAGCVITFSISNFTFGTIYNTNTEFVEPSAGYAAPINSSIIQPYTNPARALLPCVAGSGYNFGQEGELSYLGTSNSFTFSINTLTWPIPVSGTSPNYYPTAGQYYESSGSGILLTISYPGSSPINNGVGTSVSVGGGPITQMRSYASPGYLAVPASTSSPWGGVLAVGAPQTCSGVSGNFGPYALDSSMSSWDGYEITQCNLLSFGAPANNSTIGGAAAWMLQFVLTYSGSTYYAGYYNLSSTATGTYYAADPLTLPQTLTVT